ncbi:MAG: hypothetical protein BMS9Abin18_0343 [Zetaproteobacteria bacterium]|nr:MAG: hypothetical protein BMS9Abin18_0343 [Zetaproteobacteria bacterium]
MTDSFDRWFASYLKQDEKQVATLLRDRTAIQFLITWSIFESDCFNGSMSFGKINDYSKKIMSNPDYERDRFIEALKYFHGRYQKPELYKNLMYKQKSPELGLILEKGIGELTPSEEIFFLIAVVYRYRNNIFHGNKGVSSWLKFQEQINYCRIIMQELIDIAETAHNKALNYAYEKSGSDALTHTG